MDRKEKTAQALMKKKSTLMELEVQAQKVSIFNCPSFFASKCVLCDVYIRERSFSKRKTFFSSFFA